MMASGCRISSKAEGARLVELLSARHNTAKTLIMRFLLSGGTRMQQKDRTAKHCRPHLVALWQRWCYLILLEALEAL